MKQHSARRARHCGREAAVVRHSCLSLLAAIALMCAAAVLAPHAAVGSTAFRASTSGAIGTARDTFARSPRRPFHAQPWWTRPLLRDISRHCLHRRVPPPPLKLGLSYGDSLMSLDNQDLAAEFDDAVTLGVHLLPTRWLRRIRSSGTLGLR